MAYERKYKITSTVKDSYSLYKEEYGDINKFQYLKIAYEILKTISHMIITESLEYRIPDRLGFLRIKKMKSKLRLRNGRIDVNKNVIDWKATWDYWHEIYPDKKRKEIIAIEGKKVLFQTNYHTDGDIMKWYWDRSMCNIKNNKIYSFNKVKGGVSDGIYTGRLGLAAWIKSDEKTNDYFY